jgi:hypothetical protein
MKRKFWIGASFSALVIAAMAPWSASQANSVSVRVSTPEFGIRIGAPHFPRPVYQPVPVYPPVPAYYPRPYRYAPPPVVLVGGYRGHGPHWQHWQHRHWQQHRDYRHDRHGGR